MTMPKIHTNGSDSRSYANHSRPATANFVDTPPEVIEAEQAVIGCLLFSRRQTVDELISFGVAPEMFYRQAHQYLYVAALYLSQKGQRIDALTMKNRLIEMGVYDGIGGAAYLMACGESVVTTANVLSYAAIVQNHYARRMLHKEAMSLSALAQDFDGDAKDLYAIADGNLQEAMRSCLPKTAGAEDNASGIREALEGAGQGVFCGLQSIDNLLWGVMGGEMMILAARPGRGKTTLALQMARYAADIQEKWALFYSFEMSRREIFCKMLAADARVDSMKFRKGPDAFTEEERERIAGASESLSKSRMTIADTRGMTLYALRSHIRSQVRKHGKGIVFVDYLQIVAPDKAGFSRENEVSTIARGLKETAREMDIPLVALAQLSRKVDDRIDQTPNMGDLRESGTIEQEADIIAFLASRGEKDMLLCPTDVIIEKMRGGGTGEASILFDKQHGIFTEVSKSEEYAKW